MLDYSRYQRKEISMRDLVSRLGLADLYRETNLMIDHLLTLTKECVDKDVTFEPADPHAYDAAAATDEEETMPWTLGHVIVHTTASAEEAAAIAVELARGVAFRGGRSRSEVLWTTVSTIQQCRDRLEESRRMRLASLDMWPNVPALDNILINHRGEEVGPIGRYVSGLTHEASHSDQVADIVKQAFDARQ